jgi:hypothetical protein
MSIGKVLLKFAKRNSIATWASFVVRALPLFFLPVFIVGAFGEAETAIWFVLITLQGLQLLIGSSAGQSMVRGFAYALGGATQVRDLRNVSAETPAVPNMVLLGRVWSASAVAHLVIGVLTCGFLAALGSWSVAPLASLGSDPAEIWGALVLFVAGGTVRAYGGLHIDYLMGVNRIALLRWWEAAFWMAAFLAAVAAILAGGGLFELALAYQLPLAANIVWNAWLCRRDQARREGFVRRFRADLDILGQLWPSVWRTGLGTFLFLGTTQGAGLYYATVGRPEDVAAYLFAMSLIRPLGQFAQVPFFTKLPTLARMQAQGERAAQRAISQRAMALSLGLHVALVLLVAASLPVLLGLREGTLNVPMLLWLLIGLAGYVERIGAMHLQLYSTTNHILIHWANGLTSVAFVGLAAVALPVMGMYAFPVAQTVALVIAYLPFGMINSYRAFTLPFPRFELMTSVGPFTVLVLVIALIVFELN